MSEIGKRIEKRCEELKITTKELSNHSGVEYKTIRRLINQEKVNPTMENLKLLSISLNTSIDNLVFGEKEEDEDEDEEIKTLLRELKTLKKEESNRITYMVRMMIADSKREK